MLAPLFTQAMLVLGFAEAWLRRAKAGAWLQHSKVIFSFLDNSRIWDALNNLEPVEKTNGKRAPA